MTSDSAIDVPVVAPAGELDLVSSRGLGTRLGELAGAPGDAVLDLSRVTFIDSTGLGVVLKAVNRFQRQGKLLVLVAPEGGQVARLLDFAGTRERIAIDTSLDAALARLASRR